MPTPNELADELTNTDLSSPRYEAAAMLRIQAAEIERLDGKVAQQAVVHGAMCDVLMGERDQLRTQLKEAKAELEAIKSAEPAWYHVECEDPDRSGFFQSKSDALTQADEHGGSVEELFTRPVPKTEPQPWPDNCGSSHCSCITCVAPLSPKHKLVMQQALEALQEIHPGNMTPMAETKWNEAITALKGAL